MRRDALLLVLLAVVVAWLCPGCASDECEIAEPAPLCEALPCVRVLDCEDTDPGGAARACACELADGSAVWCAE